MIKNDKIMHISWDSDFLSANQNVALSDRENATIYSHDFSIFTKTVTPCGECRRANLYPCRFDGIDFR